MNRDTINIMTRQPKGSAVWAGRRRKLSGAKSARTVKMLLTMATRPAQQKDLVR